jgi:hypothetical protein
MKFEEQYPHSSKPQASPERSPHSDTKVSLDIFDLSMQQSLQTIKNSIKLQSDQLLATSSSSTSLPDAGGEVGLTHNTNNFSHPHHKLRSMLEMQDQMLRVTSNLSELTKSVFHCQQALSSMIKGLDSLPIFSTAY